MSEAYRAAGVDVRAADELVERIGPSVTATWGDRVIGGFGGFAAGVRIPAGYQKPILMLSTDGVGTKLDLARRMGRFDTIGQDLVAMCADDLAAVGAEPIAFVDYLAVGALNPGREAAIVEGVARACALAGCALVGGETAEHPGVMDRDQFDLAGTALGVVEEGRELKPGSVREGDVLVGVISPNLRSNGFSLVRRIVEGTNLDQDFEGAPLGEILLDPSVVYSKAAVEASRLDGVHGLVHVTGGGLPGNVPRVLPAGLGAVIKRSTWLPAPIFEWLTALGDLDDLDRFGAFNMGIGYVAVAERGAVETVMDCFVRHGHQARPIGEVEPGSGVRLIL